MMRRLVPTLGLAAVAPLALSAAAAPDADGTLYAQLTIRERVIIRIPRLDPRPVTRPPDPRAPRARAVVVEWEEKKAPSCVPTATLAGAHFTSDGDVDLALNDGRRIRAKLEDDCPTLNFYGGFYLQQTADGMTCAKRDAIRSRSGRRCEIGRFRALKPRR